MHRNRFAVFGHPVAHSRSPFIHAAFAAQFGIDLEYTRIDAAPDDFAAAVRRFGDEGGRGANVTLPHKIAAASLCTVLGDRAAQAGAVNTLVRLDADGAARWYGDNTDGIGLVRDLRDRHGVMLDGARVLLIGAGGAAAGVAPALLAAGVAELGLTNRSPERVIALKKRLASPRVALQPWGGWTDLDRDDPLYTIVINTTSAARDGVPVDWPLPRGLHTKWTAVDLGYGEAARPFLEAAQHAGATVGIDGLGMLVEQAAESFRLWHDVMPDTAPVYDALREGRDLR
ncbi:shikimate dehydrogenase [Cognatilysobacter terrigena]|uniref:shikimate dehydrogenase n=1 Tax=Cognatilysobacter terrigena TaxID=2488749 RepID=UPI00105F4CEE|nr:shikimate dehydrogenase [Lysobacter terrigena]